MEFICTANSKIKAQNRRYKNEPKWKYLRWFIKAVKIMFVIVPILSFFGSQFVYNIVVVYIKSVEPNAEITEDPDYSLLILLSIVLLIFLNIILEAAKNSLTAHWILDRYNEKMWVDSGQIYRTFNVQLGGGINTFRVGDDVIEEIMPIESIHQLKIDPNSGRIEFLCKGTRTVYSDYAKKIVQSGPFYSEHMKMVFYDCYEPSFIKYLKDLGIPCEEGMIDFRINSVGR